MTWGTIAAHQSPTIVTRGWQDWVGRSSDTDPFASFRF
jgi:hypothetical protein